MKSKNTAHGEQDASIDLKELAADGRELSELLGALEQSESSDSGFGRQFVASGADKCPGKPAS